MSLSSWLMYLSVVLLGTLSPGPAILLAISNAVAQGPRAAIYSSLGNVFGLLLLSAATMTGIGAVLQSSALAFSLLKALGAAYLVYLGVRRWMSLENAFERAPLTHAPRAPKKLFAEGAFLALSNPKAILFFAALFPQFLSAERTLLSQFVSLTGTLMLFSFCALMGYALLASSAKKWMATGRRTRVFNRVSGAAFVFLGLGMLRLEHGAS